MHSNYTLILMPFIELAAGFDTKTGKHKLHITAFSLMSKTQSADAQFVLLRILRSSKYI